jgi:hypothetical protein
MILNFLRLNLILIQSFFKTITTFEYILKKPGIKKGFKERDWLIGDKIA